MAMISERPRLTFATFPKNDEHLHRSFEEAIPRVRQALGQHHHNYVGGKPRGSSSEFTVRSPIDGSIIGHFAQATRKDVADAIGAAADAFDGWRTTPWRERIALLRRAADLISERRGDLGALMSIEVGKNRHEAISEAEEMADLIRFYCNQMEEHEGYVVTMADLGAGRDRTRSVLKPMGVWGIIGPFNFPIALAGGPAAAALATGNTVVVKPSSDGPLSAIRLYETLRDAGLPDGVFNIVAGAGNVVGEELLRNETVAGIVFTGSRAVGMQLFKEFAQTYPKPLIVEMGGKNPSVVSRNADLDTAAAGISESAFGYGGQKCSANSRVYAEKSIAEDLLRLLAQRADAIKVGDPTERENWLGPLINGRSVERYEAAVVEARRDGRVLAGGERVAAGALAKGFFVRPTVVGGLTHEHRVVREELFVPLTAVIPVDSMEEGIKRANDTVYGLAAGVYGDDADVALFLDRIQAGNLYINRRTSSTTGAWPGIQSFTGWKGSGTTGVGVGGIYYLQQFMREQCHTTVQ